MTEILAEQLETEESMFVQTAEGIDSDGQTLTLRGSRRRRSISPTGPSGSSGTCRPPISSTCGRSATTASRPTRRTRCSRFSSPTPTRRTTPWSCSRSRTSTAPAISLLDRGARGNRSDAYGTGHAVHRPVRTAALTHLGVRNPKARAATHATTGVLTARRGRVRETTGSTRRHGSPQERRSYGQSLLSRGSWSTSRGASSAERPTCEGDFRHQGETAPFPSTQEMAMAKPDGVFIYIGTYPERDGGT